MWFSQNAAKPKLLMQNLEKKSGNWNRMFQIYNKTSFAIVIVSQETQEKCKIQWFRKPLLQDFTTVYKETCYIELNLWHLQSFTFFAKNVPHTEGLRQAGSPHQRKA